MLQFKDFFPTQTKKFLGMTVGHREDLEQVLDRANSWLTAQSVKVISVETLLIPSSKVEESAIGEDLDQVRFNIGAFEISGGVIQVIRVWYQTSE